MQKRNKFSASDTVSMKKAVDIQNEMNLNHFSLKTFMNFKVETCE